MHSSKGIDGSVVRNTTIEDIHHTFVKSSTARNAARNMHKAQRIDDSAVRHAAVGDMNAPVDAVVAGIIDKLQF